MLRPCLGKLKFQHFEWSRARLIIIFALGNMWYKSATQTSSVSLESLWLGLLGSPPAGYGQYPVSIQIILGHPGRKGEAYSLFSKVCSSPHPFYTSNGDSACLECHSVHRKNNTFKGNLRVPGRKAEEKVKFMHIYENRHRDANHGQI